MLFPKIFLDFLKLLFNQPGGGAFKSVDVFGQGTFGMGAEKYVHVVAVVIVFQEGNVIPGCDVFSNILNSCGNLVVNHL